MSETAPAPIHFDVWGSRGSRSLIPGRSKIANFTSCYSILAGDQLIVLDAGRGLARLGYEVTSDPRFAHVKQVTLLISHAHVDHWEGLKDADWFWQRGNNAQLTLCAPDEALCAIRKGYEPPSYVPLDILKIGTAASLDYTPIAAGDQRQIADLRVSAYGLHHYSGMGEHKRPLQAIGFRITANSGAGPVICYLSDHEPTADTAALEDEMTQGADLVLYDSHYATIKEQTFGHGSIEYTASVARRLPATLVLAGHHGSSAADDKINEAFAQYGAGLGNFQLAIEGDSYAFDSATHKFDKR